MALPKVHGEADAGLLFLSPACITGRGVKALPPLSAALRPIVLVLEMAPNHPLSPSRSGTTES